MDEAILKKRYVDEEDGSYQLYEQEIMKILPKHTRHLAMINLILRGCNPVMIKEFAGHTNEATSAHYYGNITKTVRCVTKIMYDKNKNRAIKNKLSNVTESHPLSLLIDEKEEFLKVDEGKCYSQEFIRGSITDCQVCGGNCRNCRYLIPDKKDSYINSDVDIDAEMDYLFEMLKDKDIDDRLTEFQLRMQNLQKEIADFANRLWMEEKENAEKKKV